MAGHDFDNLTRSLGAVLSRRGLGLALAGSGIAALIGWSRAGFEAEAKKRRKNKNKSKKKRKGTQRGTPPLPLPPPNQAVCLDDGQPCQGDSARCCSGVCDLFTSTCVPRHSSICTPDTDTCQMTDDVLCHPTNPKCSCVVTIANAGFCGFFNTPANQSCRVCAKDADCQAEFGPDAACVVFGGLCADFCPATGGTACVPPCPGVDQSLRISMRRTE
jgi:hypothetical protein